MKKITIGIRTTGAPDEFLEINEALWENFLELAECRNVEPSVYLSNLLATSVQHSLGYQWPQLRLCLEVQDHEEVGSYGR